MQRRKKSSRGVGGDRLGEGKPEPIAATGDDRDERRRKLERILHAAMQSRGRGPVRGTGKSEHDDARHRAVRGVALEQQVQAAQFFLQSVHGSGNPVVAAKPTCYPRRHNFAAGTR